MKIGQCKNGSTTVIEIEGGLVIDALAQAKTELIALMDRARKVSFDLSKISECDAAGLQFLLMAFASMKARGTPFSVSQPSASLAQAMKRAGLAPGAMQPSDGRA